MQLDDFVVDSILGGDSAFLRKSWDEQRLWLDLSAVTTCSVANLSRIVFGVGDILGIEIGLTELTPEMAWQLVSLQTDFLIMPNLHRLDCDTAAILGGWPEGTRPIRNFTIREPISAETAKCLIGEMPSRDHCDRPLSLTLPLIGLDAAGALMSHTHELYLDLGNQILTPDLARVFSQHRGYRLMAAIGLEALGETFRWAAIHKALCSNPVKRVGIQRGNSRLVICDFDMWSSSDDEDCGGDLGRI